MIIKSAEFKIGAMSMATVPNEGMPQIAFAGRSNVGKSSLQNALLGRKGLVKVSGTPGKTREINFFAINEAFYFVDLPGLGYAKISKTMRSKLGSLITQYLEKATDLRAVIYLVDIKTGGTDLDREAIQFLQQSQIATMVVGTKSDRFNQKEMSEYTKKTQANLGFDDPIYLVSSHKGKGLKELWAHIQEAITL